MISNFATEKNDKATQRSTTAQLHTFTIKDKTEITPDKNPHPLLALARQPPNNDVNFVGPPDGMIDV